MRKQTCFFLFWSALFSSGAVYSTTLISTLQDVTQNHPDVLSQQAGLSVANHEVGIAKQQFWPTPSFSLEQAQTSGSDKDYQGDKAIKILRLQQPIWTGGRLTAQLSKAEAGVDLRLAALGETRQQLAMSTVKIWGDWCSAQAKLNAVKQGLDLHLELQSRVDRRVAEGASAPAELTLTQGRVAQVKGQYQSYKAQGDLAISRLSQLIGKPFASDRCPTWLTPPKWKDMGIDRLEVQLSDLHPTLGRLRAQLQQIRYEVDERKADLQPEVYIRAEHQSGNFMVANYPSTNRVFIGINSRFGPGMSSIQQVQSVILRQQAVEQELEGAKRKLIEQAQTLWIQHREVLARLPSLELQSRSNQVTQEAWDRQFLAGKKSWIEVMNVARDLMQSEIELADARVNAQSLLWQLALLVQGVDEVLGQK